MKVLIHTGIAGEGFAYTPGETVEVDDAEAKRWIDAGFASPATPDEPVEERKGKGKSKDKD